MDKSSQVLREYISLILKEVIGPEQQVGYGKNYHTLDPKPFTWEDYPGLEFDISADPDGSYWASVQVLEDDNMSTPTRKFADEVTAMTWIRNQYDALHRRLMNSKSE